MKEEFLKSKLAERDQQHSLRRLQLVEGRIDFCSNDYLGLARTSLHVPALSHGSGGSRLLSGNYRLIEETEEKIAAFHDGENALIYNSGYDANVGLLSCIAQRGDTILYDRLSHASIRDGIRLSFAAAHAFGHNNLNELEDRLKLATGNVFVVTESVFSMDGDFAPLLPMANLCDHYGAHLVVDEAHAIGILGVRGEGMTQHLDLHKRCFARIYTFGKGPGVHGAAVVGSNTLKQYLINFSRPFIYTTALPPASVAAIEASYNKFPEMSVERNFVAHLGEGFNAAQIPYQRTESFTPIKGVLIPGNDEARKLAQHLQQQRFDVRPIFYPTVPKGEERLRIVLHSYNTKEEVQDLLAALSVPLD
jgi:8-amino-7-oxononanoate synthase